MLNQLQLVNSEARAEFAVNFPSIKATEIRPVNPAKSLETTLNNIFPTHKTENKLQQAKRILGDTIAGLTDQELESYITEFQYLLDTWIDEFEKQIFDNKTLKQLLQEG